MLTCPVLVQAQQDLFVNVGTDIGVPINNYQNGKSGLHGVMPSCQINGHVALQYRVFDFVGIDLGIQQSFQYIQMRDKNFEAANDRFKARMKSSNPYFTYFGGLSFYLRYSRNSSVYFGGAYAMNIVGNSTTYKDAYYKKGKQTVTMGQTYLGSNATITIEAGIQTRINGGYNTFYIGLKGCIGSADFMRGGYAVLDSNSSTIYSDKLFSNGSYAGITMKYGFNLMHKDHKPRTPRQPPIPDTLATKPPIQPHDSIPATVGGRNINVTNKVAVTSSTITISVWDHEIVDGDIISLDYNGTWILENYTLKKEPWVITLTVQPGVNYLVLHAHNLGRYSPNTAAILINDGKTSQRVILESNLDSSGTIEITLGQ
jgi:hypothetical protein